MNFPDRSTFAREETHGRCASSSAELLPHSASKDKSVDKPTFVIKTLGCKANQYESQAMRESLIRYGFVEKRDNQIADFYIINSCTVTHRADRDTRNLIHYFRRINPNGRIAIAGCYAELDSDRNILMSIPGVTHLVRNSEKERIADILAPDPRSQTLDPRVLITNFEGRNRAFVKVQDGCDHKCSYCKVTLVRGPSRSRDVEEILREIKGLLKGGFKEIVLTGICLGAWGRDFPTKTDLAALVKEISRVKGLFRIRLSSIEPIYVTDIIINVLEDDDKICRHLHIPLQSGDNRILKMMNRPYTAKRFSQIIRKIRKKIPDIAITTDVLVGFPGEDDNRFLNTVKFIEDIKPSRIHVFSYSKRDGTLAVKYKHNIDRKQVRQRARILMDLSKSLSMDFAKNFVGKVQNTIIESYRDEVTHSLAGYTDRYIRVFVNGKDSLRNKLMPVKITVVDEEKNAVFGRLDNREII